MDKHLEQIGLFLATFNEIEAQSYVVLKLIQSDKIVEYATGVDRFEARVSLLQALLRSSNIPERKELESLFERALALNGYRNNLSHNPLRIKITQDQTDGSIREDPALVHARRGNRIPQAIKQLPSKLKEAEAVFWELNRITAVHTIVNSW